MDDTRDLDALLAQADWLRALARRLVGGASAEDVVQDTLIAALDAPPDPARPARPWLARVLRNVAGMRRRSEARRSRREELAGLAPAAPAAPDEVVQRLEMHRALCEVVLGLAEPYRRTLVHHYYDGRTLADLARAEGVPEATIRWRHRHALDLVRGRLDERAGGDRRSWIAALAPVGAPKAVSVAASGHVASSKAALVAGGLVMKKLAVVVAIAVVVALIGWRVVARHGDRIAAPTPAAANRPAGVPALGPGAAAIPDWFAARGAPARRIAGRVTYQGAPVRDAAVMLRSALGGTELRTGADGGFDFGVRPAAACDVAASAPDRAAAIVHLELADPTLVADQLELQLRGCEISVAGSIVDASGGPISRAHVRRGGLAGVDADDAGAYRLCVPRGESELEISADGYGGVVLAIEAHGAIRHDVVLVPEAAIAGRVVRDDGRPVAGARVALTPRPYMRDRPSAGAAIADGDGRFRIAGLTPARYQASAFADGLVSGHVEAVAELGGGPEVVLRVTAVARIRGTVRRSGAAVPGATVFATRGALRSSGTAISQLDGSFVLEGVRPGTVALSAAPYRVTAPASVRVDGARDLEGVVVEVESLGAIRGRVTRLGRPVEGATVCCVPGAPQAVTDAAGRYELRGVAAGTFAIGAQDHEAFCEPATVVVGAGEQRTLDLELDLAAAIAGEVVDQDGVPAPGVFVRWVHDQTGDLGRCLADPKGRYRCGAMTGGGRYRAAVYATATAERAFPTADGAPYPVRELADGRSVIEGARIAIKREQLEIAGRVVDRTGAPVADARVRAMASAAGQPPRFESWVRLPMTFTDRDGGYTIAGLARGAYSLQALSGDGGEGVTSNVAAGAENAIVTLDRPGRIEGTLVGFATQPAVYSVSLDGGASYRDAQVEGATFQLGGLRPGRYLVNAQVASEGDARVVDVRSAATTRVALTARGHGAIEATVVDFRTRAPIGGAACQVAMAAGGSQAAVAWDPRLAPRTDPLGRVAIDPAPAGDVIVSCLMPTVGFSQPSAAVTLAAGARATVQLQSVEVPGGWPGTIGIRFEPRTVEPRIVGVVDPAAAAGLVTGDLVVAVDGVAVGALNGSGVQYLIDGHPTGSEVSVTVQRGGARKTVAVRVEPRQYR